MTGAAATAADVSLATVPEGGAPRSMFPAVRGKNLPVTASRMPTTPRFTYGLKSCASVPLCEMVNE